MKYSKKYTKLNRQRYTTIRRHPKGKRWAIVLETYPGGMHFAKIIDIRRRTFIQLSLKLLQKDTDCVTKQEAFDLFNSFYKKPINQFSEKLYIYTMQKLRSDRWVETQ